MINNNTIIRPIFPVVGEMDGLEELKNGLYQIAQLRAGITINKTNVGNYAYRGRVALFGVEGRALTDEKGKAVTAEFYLCAYPICEVEAREKIAKVLMRLYSQNLKLINDDGIEAYKPANIVLTAAVVRYAPLFAVEKAQKSRTKSSKGRKRKVGNITKKLLDISAYLPLIPMSQMTRKHCSNKLDGLDRNDIVLLKDFWDYTLYKGLAIGDNPIVVPPIKKRDRRKASRQALDEKHSLTFDEQTALYDALEEHLSGFACGISLELGAGVPVSVLLEGKMTWSCILFEAPNGKSLENYAYLKMVYPRTCAIHTGSRVIAPRAALILRQQFDSIVEKMGLDQALLAPILSKTGDYNARLSGDAYAKDKKRILNEAVIAAGKNRLAIKSENLSRILNNTYKSNLQLIGLDKTSGLYKFYTATIAPQDTTHLNYDSMTSPVAILRMYTMYKSLDKEQRNDEIDTDTYCENGSIIKTVYPNTTHDKMYIHLKLRLNAGQFIQIESQNGVSGNIIVK